MLYDGYSNLAQIDYGNGTQSTFSYSPYSRLMNDVTLTEKNAGVGFYLLNKTITYNDGGNVESIVNTGRGAINNGQYLGGTYQMEYRYDDLNRLDRVINNSGYNLTNAATGSPAGISYELQMSYNEAGGIVQKDETIGGANTLVDYTYQGLKGHQLNNTLVSNPEGLTTNSYVYNAAGSLTNVNQTIGATTVESERYCRDEQEKIRAAKVDGTVSHYVYDHTGERLLKASLDYHSGGVNGNQNNGNYTLNPYTVYASAYYVATHYTEDVMATKHYYMGSQRVASAIINYPYVAEGGGESESEIPEDPGGQTSSLSGTETDLKNALSCLGLVENTDFDMDILLQSNPVSQRMTGTEYLAFRDALETECNEDDYCFCAIDPYWAQVYGDASLCEGLQIMYWYHPDYLGNVEYITDIEGLAYQYFFHSPWGDNIVEHHSQTATLNSPYRFNGKELDPETGNYYYGARYYQPQLSMWLSVDPLAHRFPWQTPYAFTDNNPVNLVDPDGLSAEPPSLIERAMNTLVNTAKSYAWGAVMGMVNAAGESAKDAVVGSVKKSGDDANDATHSTGSQTLNNATAIGEAATDKKTGNLPKVNKAAGALGTAADIASVVTDAATTDFDNPEETGDFVESTVQTAAEAAAGALGPAVNIIIEDAKSDDGLTNLDNGRMSESYKTSRNDLSAYERIMRYNNGTDRIQQRARKEKVK